MLKKSFYSLFVLLVHALLINAQTPRSCKQILLLNNTLPSGVYTIDPDGSGPLPSMQCQCDMTSDGGGWTLVLNYNHLTGTNPPLNVRTNDLPLIGSSTLGVNESGTQYWGHADTSILRALNFGQVWFYGITSNHSRVINFKTSHAGTVNYFKTGTGSTAGLVSNFTPYPGHTANLPAAINSTTSNQGVFAMTEYPMWAASAYHWFLSPALSRWEVDDFQTALPSTYHQIWVRECATYSSITDTVCDSVSYNGQSFYNSGTYTQTLQNSEGCDSVITLNLIVNLSPSIAVSPATAIICGTDSVTITASGASSYVWSPGNGLSSATGSMVNAYSTSSLAVLVTGTSPNGCIGTDSVHVIHSNKSVTLSKTDASCSIATDGSVSAAPSGGTAPYTYLWSNGATDSTVSNLAPGTYTVTVNDASCTVSGVELITNGNFDAGNTGFTSALTYTPPPNTAGAQYWVGTAPQSWNGLYCSCTEHSGGSGNFMFLNGDGSPHDSSWCQTVAVTPNTTYYFSAWVTTLYPVSQADLALLQIFINGQPQSNVFNTPGTCCTWQQIFVQWNSGPSSSAGICIVNNCLSSFGNDFGLDDISFQECTPSCAITDSITIGVLPPFIISIDSTNISCNGTNDGTATATVTGGTAPYNYSWSNGGTTSSISNLSPGTYTLTVSETNLCTQTQTVTITEPSAITIDFTTINVACNGNTNGSITATTNGGSPPYTYSWSSGGVLATESNLGTGIYTLTVTDDSSCVVSKNDTITEPPLLVVSVSNLVNVGCYGDSSGAVVGIASGGVSPYSYQWSNGDTSSAISLLTASTYTLIVKDSNNCADTLPVTIGQPVALTASITSSTNVSCYNGSDGSATVNASGGTSPYSYAWTGGGTTGTEGNLAAGSYTVTVTDSNSCVITQTVNITQPDSINISTFTNQALCTNNNGNAAAIVSGGTGPYNYSWSSGGNAAAENNLTAGTYTITITDANTCVKSQTVVVTSSNPLTLTISSTETPCLADSGTATVIPANGTIPYSYSWSSLPVQSTQTALNLAVGNYTVTVTDADGCVQTQTVSVAQTPNPVASVSASSSTIILGETITLTAAGGNTYQWSPSNGLNCDTCNITLTKPETSITYCVKVIDANGCDDSVCVNIMVEIPCGNIEIPTAFSPNNDGHNDLFKLQGLGSCVEAFVISIFDRWGEKVFETQNINTFWDGTYKSRAMDAGVFVFYLKAKLVNGTEVDKKGNISLIR